MEQKVDLMALPSIKCKCGNETFAQVFFLKKVPALLVGALVDGLAKIEVFQCTNCKNLLDFAEDHKKSSEKEKKKGFFLQ